jgi:hypothetical protein
MAFIKSALILLALALFVFVAEARPFTDSLTGGTILAPYGGALGKFWIFVRI